MQKAIETLKTPKKPETTPEERAQLPIADDKLDFPAIAYERLKNRAGPRGFVTKREYYRLCGCHFTLTKERARQLLGELVERYGVEIGRENITF